jgi:L-threonylcarbamoyladenylate synthase
VPLILDDGATEAGLESTILAGRTILRPGPITAAELPFATTPYIKESVITAPGQLATHYAPRKPLRLEAGAARPGEWLIGFGAITGDDSLSASGNLREAAARLFDALHRADASDRTEIAVAPVPHEGLGEAINDRLGRAAHR